MILKLFRTLLILMMTAYAAGAKTFELTSVNKTKPFTLRIYCTVEGKGAFAQYNGQQGVISLHIKKFTVSALTNTSKQPEGYYYKWDEVFNGKVTGTYEVVEHSGNVTDATYLRFRDGKRFRLKASGKNVALENVQKYLLHGVLITFTLPTTDSQFSFTYPDGRVVSPDYASLDSPDKMRTSYINDYNFDGYDDVAFSVPDAGMGVYHIFTIWLYNPVTKRFDVLKEPQDQRGKCSCLCDVTLNSKHKLLYTACRGGARWWQDVYRIDKDNNLIWQRSTEKK